MPPHGEERKKRKGPGGVEGARGATTAADCTLKTNGGQDKRLIRCLMHESHGFVAIFCSHNHLAYCGGDCGCCVSEEAQSRHG